MGVRIATGISFTRAPKLTHKNTPCPPHSYSEDDTVIFCKKISVQKPPFLGREACMIRSGQYLWTVVFMAVIRLSVGSSGRGRCRWELVSVCVCLFVHFKAWHCVSSPDCFWREAIVAVLNCCNGLLWVILSEQTCAQCVKDSLSLHYAQLVWENLTIFLVGKF